MKMISERANGPLAKKQIVETVKLILGKAYIKKNIITRPYVFQIRLWTVYISHKVTVI